MDCDQLNVSNQRWITNKKMNLLLSKYAHKWKVSNCSQCNFKQLKQIYEIRDAILKYGCQIEFTSEYNWASLPNSKYSLNNRMMLWILR